MTGLQALHPRHQLVATTLEVVGVLVIVGGLVLASLTFVREGRGETAWRDAIATITGPLTVQSIALMGAVLFIRTFLSFSLEIKIRAYWPWERARRARREPDRER